MEIEKVYEVEITTAEDGRATWKLPMLKDDEYYAAKLKKGGYIRPTNGEPYLSKDKFFWMNFRPDIHDLQVVRKINKDEDIEISLEEKCS